MYILGLTLTVPLYLFEMSQIDSNIFVLGHNQCNKFHNRNLTSFKIGMSPHVCEGQHSWYPELKEMMLKRK